MCYHVLPYALPYLLQDFCGNFVLFWLDTIFNPLPEVLLYLLPPIFSKISTLLWYFQCITIIKKLAGNLWKYIKNVKNIYLFHYSGMKTHAVTCLVTIRKW